MTMFFPYYWFFSSFLTFSKKLTNNSHFQYLSPYQHININIPHTNITHTTYQHINIPHITYPHTHISHITYPNTNISHVFAPNFVCVNIPLSSPKTIPLLEFKNIFWNWSLQINGILMNSAFGLYQLVSSGTLPLFLFFFLFFFQGLLS